MYRIVVAIVVVLALWRLLARARQGVISTRRMLVWVAFWLGVLVLGLWPQLSDIVSDWAGIERGATLVFFISILLLFYLILQLYIRIESQQKQITDLVRQLALREHLSPPGGSKSVPPASAESASEQVSPPPQG